MNYLTDKKFLFFVGKFMFLFCLFYFGTSAVIGLAAPGDYYIPFVGKYLDYVSWIKYSLLWAVKHLAGFAGYETVTEPGFIISVVNQKGIIIAMNCVGYGVYSVWAAYVIANDGNWKNKMVWVIVGLLLLWLINTIRISLFLIAINKGWPMPLGLDHHTWFNVFAYAAIFALMFFFDKRRKTGPEH
jgi:exosortase/archaeosortase family protein